MKDKEEKKVVGVVVIFEPIDSFLINLIEMRKQVDYLYVIDNTVGNSSEEFLGKLSNDQISIFKNANKGGIAGALNIGVEKALSGDYEWIVFFDQDSKPRDEMVAKMLSHYLDIKDNSVVSILPNYYDINSKYYYRPIASIYRDSFNAMTSGQVVKTSFFKDIGYRFDEKLFIYFVDTDLILFLNSLKYRSIECDDAILDHSPGKKVVYTIPIINKSFYLDNNSSFALFYLHRNTILISKRYSKNFPKIIQTNLVNLLKKDIKIILFEKNKISKISSAFRGLIEGFALFKSF
jgi:rhamnosyltransferase